MTPKERARDLYMQASIHYDEIKDVAAAIEAALKEERERIGKRVERLGKNLSTWTARALGQDIREGKP